MNIIRVIAILSAFVGVVPVYFGAQDMAVEPAQHVQAAGDQGAWESVPPWVQGHIAGILSPPMGARLRENFASVQYELTNPRVSASPPNFQIQLDNRDPVTTHFTSYTFTGLTPGPHTVSVQVVDGNGTAIAGARSQTQFIVLEQAEIPRAVISGRNVFRAEADIPRPIALPLKEEAKVAPSPPQGPQPSPVIKLKFFGFAAGTGQPTKVFLSKGDDVFVAGVGEIVNRRYKVMKINPSSVEIEDILRNSRQTVPLATD